MQINAFLIKNQLKPFQTIQNIIFPPKNYQIVYQHHFRERWVSPCRVYRGTSSNHKKQIIKGNIIQIKQNTPFLHKVDRVPGAPPRDDDDDDDDCIFQKASMALSLLSLTGYLCSSPVPFRQPRKKMVLASCRPLRASGSSSNTAQFLFIVWHPCLANFGPQNRPQKGYKMCQTIDKNQTHFWIPF